MRMALLGLVFVGACASAPAPETRPAQLADTPAQACAVQLDAAAIAGYLVESAGLSLCVPTHWRASGSAAWRFTGGSAALIQPVGERASARYVASTGPHASSEVLWRQSQVQTVSSGTGGSSQAARMEGGAASRSTERAAPASREWNEELDGVSAHFIVTANADGSWHAAARLTSGGTAITARGLATSVAGIEEQLAVYRTLRITGAALSR